MTKKLPVSTVMPLDQFRITFVYAKCKDSLKRPLWEKLIHHANTELPWCIVGNFKFISSIEEKMGRVPYNIIKYFEFISVIEACGLIDLGYNGHQVIWSNLRGTNFRVRKRLDRGMVNDKWLEDMPHSTITYLPYIGSDHFPLLLEMVDTKHNPINYSRFLNCWTEHHSFMETIERCWNREITSNPMWIIQ